MDATSVRSGQAMINEYAFEHKGRQFVPSGATGGIDSVTEHNADVERQEIESLKQHPERLFLYVRFPQGACASSVMANAHQGSPVAITTWLGTQVSERVEIGPRRNVGFGYHTYRRSVDCRIFGVRYVGWYMESSGQYCRLRKAKVQN